MYKERESHVHTGSKTNEQFSDSYPKHGRTPRAYSNHELIPHAYVNTIGGAVRDFWSATPSSSGLSGVSEDTHLTHI